MVQEQGEHYISHYLRTIGHFLFAAAQSEELPSPGKRVQTAGEVGVLMDGSARAAPEWEWVWVQTTAPESVSENSHREELGFFQRSFIYVRFSDT